MEPWTLLRMIQCHTLEMILLTILAVLMSTLQCSAYGETENAQVIYIESKKGNDSKSCISSQVHSCQSLNWALQSQYRMSDTQYILLDSGPHELGTFNDSTEASFFNISNIAFIGSEANTTIQCNGEETGLVFINSLDLLFVNVTLVGCVSIQTSTSAARLQLGIAPFTQASLFFYHCYYVNLYNVRVQTTTSSSRTMGVVMFVNSEVNTIANSSFVQCNMEVEMDKSFLESYCYVVDGVWYHLESNMHMLTDASLDHSTIDALLCPPGFKPKNSTNGSKCVCARSYQESLTCDQDSNTAYLNNNNWMGHSPELQKFNDGNYVAVICAPGYCYTNATSGTFLLPNNTEHLDRLVCGTQNRTGIACGKCIEGFGPAINSRIYECVDCSDPSVVRGNIAKYVFSVYVPLAILFTFIILFDIRLTTGPANAFIFYSQVVTTTFDLDADGQLPLYLVTNSSNYLLNVYRFPYGILNLEFIEKFLPSLCVGTNLNALSIMLMNYAVALAPTIMIVLVLLCIKLSTLVSEKFYRGDLNHLFQATCNRTHIPQRRRRLSEAILPAFAAFLLLSYNKFSTTSTFIVGSQPLLRDDGSAVSPRRVYYAGQYSIDDYEYCTHYLLPAAIIFSTFVAIPPLLLLDYPLRAFEWCLSKANCLWRFYPVDKVHVFLDTFQGCYKNKMRFFAGLYFLFRLVINIAYLSTDTWLEQFCVQQVICAIMTLLLALFRPYKRKWLNYVDILMLTNLSVLNALTLYLYSYYQINTRTSHLPISVFAVQYVLVLLPLFYMVSYIVWCLSQPYHHSLKNGFMHMKRRLELNRYRNLETFPSINSAQTSSQYGSTLKGDINESEIEDILERAEEQNTYKKLQETVAHSPENERPLSPNIVIKGRVHTQSQTY